MLFDTNYHSSWALENYINRLGLQRQEPTLDYLNKLIRSHQENIPFENFTRIIEFHSTPNKFPTLEEYLNRFTEGTGGVCWSHARSFKWLLTQLGFKVEYLYMEPGHVCLKVNLDQNYYVDVGYAAPFFEAYPLKHSFEVQASSELFQYQVHDSFVEVIRTPGPTKKLHLKRATELDLEMSFTQGNTWKQNRFLSILVINKYENGNLIRLNNELFYDYRSGEKVEKTLDMKEVEKVLSLEFKIDPKYYFEAKKLLSTLV